MNYNSEIIREDIDALLKLFELQQKAQSANENSRVQYYTPILRAYLQCGLSLAKYGMDIPNIEPFGETRNSAIELLEAQKDEVVKRYHSLKDILEKSIAEEEYVKLTAEISLQNASSSYSSDVILLTSDQRKILQDLISKLRQATHDAKWSSDEYKQRVLDQINKLQREFDREISSYSRGLGLLMITGDAIGEFATKVKPVTDRVKELMDSFKLFKRDNLQIGKADDPLQITDQSEDA